MKRRWFNINNGAKLHSRCVLQVVSSTSASTATALRLRFWKSFVHGRGLHLNTNLGMKCFLENPDFSVFWLIFWRKISDFFTIPMGAHPDAWRKLRFSFDQMFHKCQLIIQSTDYAAENSKTRVMLRDQRGDQPSKNGINLDFSSDSARILVFMVSAVRCEAKRTDWRREERPIGSCAVRMLIDLLRRARGLADWEHVCTTGRYDVKERRVR